MGEHIDAREVHDLVKILAQAPDVAPAEARKVVIKGAVNIKADARRRASGLAHAPAYPRAITYDSHVTPGGAWAEIGPDKNLRQGALGNILEHGTRKNAPIPHMGPAGDAEAPRFARAMEDLAEQATGLQ
jgi:hypothetical protein